MITMITCDVLLLFIFTLPNVVLTEGEVNEQRSSKSILNSDFNGYEILESDIIRVNGVSLIRCSSLCTERPSCLSLNYDKINKTCVLFDKDFTVLSETSTSYCGDSWFYYYVVRDVEMKSAQCNSPFMVDVCSLFCLYYIHIHDIYYSQFESECNAYDGGQMVIIDRDLKQLCVKTLIAQQSSQHDVYIQGKRNDTTNRWTYNDGTVMSFFNWKSGQPENRTDEVYLITKRNENYLWDDTFDDTAVRAAVCQQT